MSKVKTDNLEVYTSGGSLSILSPVAVSAGQQATMNGPFTSNNASVFNGAGNSVTVDSGNVLAKGNLYVGPSSSSPGCTLAASGAATVGTLTAGAATFNGQIDLNSNSIVDVNAITCSSLSVGGNAIGASKTKAFCNATLNPLGPSITGGTGFASVTASNGANSTKNYDFVLSTALTSTTNTVVMVTPASVDSNVQSINFAQVVDVNTIRVNYASTGGMSVAIMVVAV